MQQHDCLTEHVDFRQVDSGDTLATCTCGRREMIPANIGAVPKRHGLASRMWAAMQERTVEDSTAFRERLATRAEEVQSRADADCARVLAVLVVTLAVIWWMV
jgi:hypothetical protein